MQIDKMQITTKQTVWYRYSKVKNAAGPFIVQRFYNDYEGRHVVLRRTQSRAIAERNVLLADDRDFGALSFYDTDPAIQPEQTNESLL